MPAYSLLHRGLLYGAAHYRRALSAHQGASRQAVWTVSETDRAEVRCEPEHSGGRPPESWTNGAWSRGHAAGLSDHQLKQAIRVANVPKDDFRARGGISEAADKER
jgi:hypothetical protein